MSVRGRTSATSTSSTPTPPGDSSAGWPASKARPTGGHGEGGDIDNTMIVRRTGQAPLRIRGELLAAVAQSMNNASTSYSGSPGRCSEVKLYRTATGKHVVSILHRTIWQGEHDTHEAAVYPDLGGCLAYIAARMPGWVVDAIVAEIGEDAVAEDVA